MDRKETPISTSLLGILKEGDCPVCGKRLLRFFGSKTQMCPACGDYVEFGDKTMRQMDPASVTSGPYFAAPTPWPDMQAPTFGALTFPVAALADMIQTKKEGVRVMEARWPEGCCVCGRPSTENEIIQQQVGFAPPNGNKPRQQKEAFVIARGIPHCAEHKDGVRFAYVTQMGTLGLVFRSYSYQMQFRKLNPWPWKA